MAKQTDRQIKKNKIVLYRKIALAVALIVVALTVRLVERKALKVAANDFIGEGTLDFHGRTAGSITPELDLASTGEKMEKATSPSSVSLTGLATAWPIKDMPEANCSEPIEASQGHIQIPSFIIPGAQKSGTSAIYKLLSMHPHVLSSRRFEVHFFDRKLKLTAAKDPATVSDTDICKRRLAYQKEFKSNEVTEHYANHPDIKIATFEKSPRYLCIPHIAGYVKRIVPWTKVLITLRDPVERAFSHFKMDYVNFGRQSSFRTFEQFIEKEVATMKKLGLSQAPSLLEYQHNATLYTDADFTIPENQTMVQRKMDVENYSLPYQKRSLLMGHISRGFYAQQIASWLDHFELGENLKVIQYEQLKKDEKGMFREILEFIEVDPDMLDAGDEVYVKDFRPTKAATDQSLDDTLRSDLKKLYKPYNDELADLLGEEWREAWD